MRALKYWLPVAMVIGIMYYFSTDDFSADNSRSMIERIYLWFSPRANNHALANLNYLVRKSAHFSEYALLGVLLYRAYRMDNNARWRFKWALFAFGSAVVWALVDEFHQTFTRTRSGSIWDALLDSTGALFALVIIRLYCATRRTADSR